MCWSCVRIASRMHVSVLWCVSMASCMHGVGQRAEAEAVFRQVAKMAITTGSMSPRSRSPKQVRMQVQRSSCRCCVSGRRMWSNELRVDA